MNKPTRDIVALLKKYDDAKYIVTNYQHRVQHNLIDALSESKQDYSLYYSSFGERLEDMVQQHKIYKQAKKTVEELQNTVMSLRGQ